MRKRNSHPTGRAQSKSENVASMSSRADLHGADPNPGQESSPPQRPATIAGGIDRQLAEMRGSGPIRLQKVQPCGSLMARKLKNGAVIFFWRATHQGELSRVDVGLYSPTANRNWKTPAEDGRYSVTAAIARASEIAHEHTQAIPLGGYLGKRKAEELARVEAEAGVIAQREALKDQTLAKLLELYWTRLKDLNRKSWASAKNSLTLHVLSHSHAQRPACEITDEDIADMLRPMHEAGITCEARKMRAYLHAAYRMATMGRTDPKLPPGFKALNVRTNPVASTPAVPVSVNKDPLDMDEMRTYWRRIVGIPGAKGAMLRLHLLFGAPRIEQFVRARCIELNDEALKLWDNKGRPGAGPRAHVLPLTDLTRASLKLLTKEGEFLFSTTNGKLPIANTTLSLWAKEAVGDKIKRFTLKRTRSGVETLLAGLKIDPRDRGHLQSHGITGVQSKHYDGYDYFDEKYDALEALHKALVSDEPPVLRKVRSEKSPKPEPKALQAARANSVEGDSRGGFPRLCLVVNNGR